MKLCRIGLAFTFIVVVTIAVSGCLQGFTSPMPLSGTAGPSASTTRPSGPAYRPVVDFGSIRIFEYTFNTTTGDMPMKGTLRVERTSAPFGGTGNAVRTRTNKMASTSAGISSTYVDVYTDPSSGAVLGGHITITIGGQMLANQDIAAGEQVDKAHTGTPILTVAMEPDLVSKLESVGTGRITVPAGTFDCTKYTRHVKDDVMTYWIATNVPIPVKMVTVDNVTGRATMTMELVSYS